MRVLTIGVLLLTSGCFRWAPVSSLSSIEDDRVEVHSGGSVVMLDHATAHGRVIEGQPVSGAGTLETSDACALPACGRIDVSSGGVVKSRQLNVPVTAAVITLSALGVAGTVFGVAVLIILSSFRGVPTE